MPIVHVLSVYVGHKEPVKFTEKEVNQKTKFFAALKKDSTVDDKGIYHFNGPLFVTKIMCQYVKNARLITWPKKRRKLELLIEYGDKYKFWALKRSAGEQMAKRTKHDTFEEITGEDEGEGSQIDSEEQYEQDDEDAYNDDDEIDDENNAETYCRNSGEKGNSREDDYSVSWNENEDNVQSGGEEEEYDGGIKKVEQELQKCNIGWNSFQWKSMFSDACSKKQYHLLPTLVDILEQQMESSNSEASSSKLAEVDNIKTKDDDKK